MIYVRTPFSTLSVTEIKSSQQFWWKFSSKTCIKAATPSFQPHSQLLCQPKDPPYFDSTFCQTAALTLPLRMPNVQSSSEKNQVSTDNLNFFYPTFEQRAQFRLTRPSFSCIQMDPILRSIFHPKMLTRAQSKISSAR